MFGSDPSPHFPRLERLPRPPKGGFLTPLDSRPTGWPTLRSSRRHGLLQGRGDLCLFCILFQCNPFNASSPPCLSHKCRREAELPRAVCASVCACAHVCIFSSRAVCKDCAIYSKNVLPCLCYFKCTLGSGDNYCVHQL